ncbi:penicillin-binding protein activator [Candidatus Micrarchaeota archaeon]|nr:penicillin-binding protein activator [Candidatus Micrarchaeota archaeon]MBU1930487.1 penicillin-binding protein activator [Candidatus Micrarchaeota archaeon]
MSRYALKKGLFWSVIGLIVLFSVFFLFGCIETPQEQKTKVGVLMPLTGFLSHVGQDTRHAIEMAFEDLGASNDIELVFEDEMCNATQALTAYRKLVDIDQVDFIIGPFCGQSAMSVLSFLNQQKIIAISPGAPDNELSQANDYFFRTRVPNKVETKKIVDFLIEKGIIRVATYTAKNTFGESFKNSFIEQFTAQGGEIVFSEGSTDSQSEFRTEIIKIKETNPEAVFLVPASRQQMGIFVKQTKELDFFPLIVGAAVTKQQDLLDAAGNAADGIIYPYTLDQQNLFPKQEEIYNRFLDRYNRPPTMEVLNGYDAFQILFTKIKECNANKECVRTKLNELKDFDGVTGLVSFDEFGDSQVSLILKTIQNGEFIRYEE